MTNEKILKFWNSQHKWPVIIAIVIGIGIGLIFSGGTSTPPANESTGTPGHDHASASAKEEIWTCSMDPQVRQPKPGKCPICGMDLVLLEDDDSEHLGPRQLKLSSYAIKLAEIETAPVERRFVDAYIRMSGKVEVDETNISYITSFVPGRIDRLYVDYTGTTVRKGDHLVYLYSPELITAQEELLQSMKTLKRMGKSISAGFRRTAQRTVNAAREKLRLWGLTPGQIKDIEKRGKAQDHLTIYSPVSGIVVHKNAVEGVYVKTGSKIYTIADLSQVWVKLDVYESDLTWIRYGQKVEFETEAYPGETFTGKISFIDPVLNSKTRTVKVRVNVPNPTGRLKPQMFVRAVVRSKLSVSGTVMDPALVGKWISPMHPEIVKDGPGACDKCGMRLVRAEKMGYVAAGTDAGETPLIIPATAALITGTRAVVYVAVKGKEGIFEGKVIRLGARAGNHYIVKEGLQEGEMVVVNGAFKIDSDLQIKAKPSMMNPEGGGPSAGHQHGQSAKVTVKAKTISPKTVPMAFKMQIDALAAAYFDVQTALSSDSLIDAKTAGNTLLAKLKAADMKLIKGDAHMLWMDMQKTIQENTKKMIDTVDIETARFHFETLYLPVSNAIQNFSHKTEGILKFHCPMAFDNKGAYWLQNNPDTRNPYYGSSMLTCKDSVEPLVK